MSEGKMGKCLQAVVAGGLVLAALTSPAWTAAEPQSHYALVKTVLEQHVLPGFESLNARAAKLPEAVSRVCTVGEDADREILDAAFRETVLAWARVEFLRFGPLTDAGRRERLSFLPDPRGIMNRQLRQLIAGKDVKSISDGAIAKQSAAVQGLPALEAIITDKEMPLAPGEAAEFRCMLATAIASNIHTLSAQLNDAWSKTGGWKDKMLRPGSDNETYKEPQEAASELVKALLVGLQLVGDGQVKPHLSNKGPVIGPYAKSNLSKLYFAASAQSLERFYDALALESYLPESKDWVKNWAGGAWRTIKSSDGAGGRGEGVAKGDEPTVHKVFSMFSGLRKIIVGEMSVAAGLTVGFNELDGD